MLFPSPVFLLSHHFKVMPGEKENCVSEGYRGDSSKECNKQNDCKPDENSKAF